MISVVSVVKRSPFCRELFVAYLARQRRLSAPGNFPGTTAPGRESHPNCRLDQGGMMFCQQLLVFRTSIPSITEKYPHARSSFQSTQRLCQQCAVIRVVRHYMYLVINCMEFYRSRVSLALSVVGERAVSEQTKIQTGRAGDEYQLTPGMV
jgi:hypothetical protein